MGNFSINGVSGSWARGSYAAGVGYHVDQIYGADFVQAAKDADTYETIFFWPFGMDLGTAQEWWKEEHDGGGGSGEADQADRSSSETRSDGSAKEDSGGDTNTREETGGSHPSLAETEAILDSFMKLSGPRTFTVRHLQVCSSARINPSTILVECDHGSWYNPWTRSQSSPQETAY